MSINYAGLHLIGENYVTRPLSQQTYTNKMADAIHGAEAYIVPRKVDNTYRNMFEDLCKSPQIQHIRTVLHNSRATFGESGEDAESRPPAESPPKDIPPTKGQIKSAVKQQAKDAAAEAKGSKSAVRFEVEEAIAEAKRLSSAKKAKPVGTPLSQKSFSSFVTANSALSDDANTPASAKSTSSKKSSKKAAKLAATPRALEAAFQDVAATPKIKMEKAKGLNLKGAGASAPAPEAKAAEVRAAPAAEVKEASSRAAKINAFVTQTNGANGVVTIIQATGRGAKGFRPAYVGHDGVALGYLDSEVSVVQLRKMVESFEKVKGKVPDADKATRKDIGNYISRIKDEIKKRG